MNALPVRGTEGRVSLDERVSECMSVLLKYAQVLSIERIKSIEMA
jgi:hypothetical protein